MSHCRYSRRAFLGAAAAGFAGARFARAAAAPAAPVALSRTRTYDPAVLTVASVAGAPERLGFAWNSAPKVLKPFTSFAPGAALAMAAVREPSATFA